jgi:hypothetical protein
MTLLRPTRKKSGLLLPGLCVGPIRWNRTTDFSIIRSARPKPLTWTYARKSCSELLLLSPFATLRNPFCPSLVVHLWCNEAVGHETPRGTTGHHEAQGTANEADRPDGHIRGPSCTCAGFRAPSPLAPIATASSASGRPRSRWLLLCRWPDEPPRLLRPPRRPQAQLHRPGRHRCCRGQRRPCVAHPPG